MGDGFSLLSLVEPWGPAESRHQWVDLGGWSWCESCRSTLALVAAAVTGFHQVHPRGALPAVRVSDRQEAERARWVLITLSSGDEWLLIVCVRRVGDHAQDRLCDMRLTADERLLSTSPGPRGRSPPRLCHP